MNTDAKFNYLVISRGQWDKDTAKEEIQQAIDQFYVWLTRSIEEGRMKMGSRLADEGATVSKSGIATDGPFGEAKEAIGGYWFIVASSLQEAAKIAAENPCLKHGLFFEIRPTDPERASAFSVMTETPDE
ncbi:MAG: YciI family protein [Verrucomicrobiales bacterium]|nr:YciI family protein [Verrucomicrobiales bacterium]